MRFLRWIVVVASLALFAGTVALFLQNRSTALPASWGAGAPAQPVRSG